MLADEAALLVNERFVTAVGTLLSLCCRAIEHVLLECAGYADLPGVDVFTLKLQRADKLAGRTDDEGE